MLQVVFFVFQQKLFISQRNLNKFKMTDKTQDSSLFYQKYHIESEIGRGASGVCYKIKRVTDGKYFALKKISSNSLKKNSIKGAYNEVRILSGIDHPNIIRYIESFMSDQQLYIVMQYAQRGDLHTILKKRKLKHHYFEQTQLWMMMKQLLQGLEYLHNKNIIHRDVKTLNIFVDQNGGLLIGDLGVSKIVKSDLGLYSRVGTPLYLAPEIIKYEKYDFKADIWGLGCVSYLLATLNPPFEGQNIITLGQSIVGKAPKPIQRYSENIHSFILQMLQKNHLKRPNSTTLLKKYFVNNEFLKKQMKLLQQPKSIQNSLIEAKTGQIEQNPKQNEKSFRRYFTSKRVDTPEQNFTPKVQPEQKAILKLRNQKKFRYMIGNFVNDVMDKKLQKKQTPTPLISNRTFESTIAIKPYKLPTQDSQFKNNNEQLTKYKKQIINKTILSSHNIKLKQVLISNNYSQKDKNSQTDQGIPSMKSTGQKFKRNSLVQSAQCFVQLKEDEKILPDKKSNISIRKMVTDGKYVAETENLRRNRQGTAPEIKDSQEFIRSSKHEKQQQVPNQQSELFSDIFRLSNDTTFYPSKNQPSNLSRFKQRPKSSIGRKQRYYESSTAKGKKKQNVYSNFYSIIQTQVLKKPQVIIL